MIKHGGLKMLEGKALYDKLKSNLEKEIRSLWGDGDDTELSVLTPHLLCELAVIGSLDEWYSDNWSLLGREILLPRGRADIIIQSQGQLKVIDVKCLYNSGKTNQQANLDKGIGQIWRYIDDLKQLYFGLHCKYKITGSLILTFTPYKNPDLSMFVDTISIRHPGNDPLCQKLRHLIDVSEMERYNNIIAPVISDDAIRDWNDRIDSFRALAGA